MQYCQLLRGHMYCTLTIVNGKLNIGIIGRLIIGTILTEQREEHTSIGNFKDV